MSDLTQWLLDRVLHQERTLWEHRRDIDELEAQVVDHGKKIRRLHEPPDHWLSAPEPAAVMEWLRVLVAIIALGALLAGNLSWDIIVKLL